MRRRASAGKMRLPRLAILALVLLEGARAQASTQPPPPSSELLLNSSSANDAFAAVRRFRRSLTCTGFLLDPSSSDASDAQAWLMTAGHCISLEPYGVIGNQPFRAQVQFNYFIDTPDRQVTIRTRAVGWSTMKGADLA